MARRRQLNDSKDAPFTKAAGKVPFTNPRNLLVAQDWMRANGGTARDGIFIVDLYGRWMHKSNERFTKRRLQADYQIGKRSVDKVVEGTAALAGLEISEVLTQSGRVKGFTMRRATGETRQTIGVSVADTRHTNEHSRIPSGSDALPMRVQCAADARDMHRICTTH